MSEDLTTVFAVLAPCFAVVVTGLAVFIGCANKPVPSKENSAAKNKRTTSNEATKTPKGKKTPVNTKEGVPQKSIYPVKSKLKNTSRNPTKDNTTYDDGEYENVSELEPQEKTAVSA